MNKSIKDIKAQFETEPIQNIKSLIQIYKDDNRKGVKDIIKTYENKLLIIEKQKIKLQQMKTYENQAYLNGKQIIGGIDEVGRGPFAGPVVTCCVILPKDFDIIGIDDSKKLSEAKRKELFFKIKQNAIEIAINMEHNDIIDDINILEATKKSMIKNIQSLKNKPDFLILDAINLNTDIPYISMAKADEKSVSVAAASIIAKVTRDEYMEQMHKIYPQYKFNVNKGYGTKEHIQALKKYGACPIHRKTFIKNYV